MWSKFENRIRYQEIRGRSDSQGSRPELVGGENQRATRYTIGVHFVSGGRNNVASRGTNEPNRVKHERGTHFFRGEHDVMRVAFHPSPSAYLVGKESLRKKLPGLSPGIFLFRR